MPLTLDQREKIHCNLCGVETSEELMCEKKGRLGPDPFSIVKCSQCGLVYVNPRLKKEVIKNLYDKDYYTGDNWDEKIDYEGALKETEKFWRKFRLGNLPEILFYKPWLKGLKILDVGCALGNFMIFLKEQGAEVEGIEWSEYAGERGRSMGLKIHTGDIHSLRLEAAKFDVVVAREVIEHVYDPLAFVQEISRLLKPNGLFYYTTGNVAAVGNIQEWEYVRPEGHITYFSPKTMAAYFEKTGLKSVPRLSSIEYYFDYIRFGSYVEDPKLERLKKWGILGSNLNSLKNIIVLTVLWWVLNLKRKWGGYTMPLGIKE